MEAAKLTSNDIYNMLVEFAANKEQPHLNFPATLSSSQRRIVHEFAENLKLGHESVGEGHTRFIQVTHTPLAQPAAPPPTKKGGKREKTIVIQQRGPRGRGNNTENKKIPQGMSEILEDFLFLGSGKDANDIHQLMQNKIGCIVNVAREWQNKYPTSFSYFSCHLADEETENVYDTFEECFRFINTAKKLNKRVLVHCVIGKSRSSSVVIGYLMKYNSMTLRDSFDHVKARRSIIQPNSGFMHQLLRLEEEIQRQKFLESDEAGGLIEFEYKPSMKEEEWAKFLAAREKNNAMKGTSEKKKRMKERKEFERDETKGKVEEFVRQFLTEEQMRAAVVSHCEGRYEKKRIPALLRWASELKKTEKEEGKNGEGQDGSNLIEEQAKLLGVSTASITSQIGAQLKLWYLDQMENSAVAPTGAQNE